MRRGASSPHSDWTGAHRPRLPVAAHKGPGTQPGYVAQTLTCGRQMAGSRPGQQIMSRHGSPVFLSGEILQDGASGRVGLKLWAACILSNLRSKFLPNFILSPCFLGISPAPRHVNTETLAPGAIFEGTKLIHSLNIKTVLSGNSEKLPAGGRVTLCPGLRGMRGPRR